MKFSLTVEMDSAAFQGKEGWGSGNELAMILHRLALLVEGENLRAGWYQHMVDSNRESCAEARISGN